MNSEERRPIFGRGIVWLIFIILIIIIIFLLLRCCTCGKNEKDTVIHVESVSVYPESLNLKVGETGQLTVIINPSDATNKEYECKSNDEKIATVDSTCLVTGVAVGETTIVITTGDGNKIVTADVTVTDDSNGDDNGDNGDNTPKAPGLTFKCDGATYKSDTWCKTDITPIITGNITEKKMCANVGTKKCNPFKDKLINIDKSGTYTVCAGYILNGVQSKVTCKTIVAKVDKTAPTCKYSIVSGKLRATCSDTGSGIGYYSPEWTRVSTNIYDHTLRNIEGNQQYSLTVKDVAGNQYSGYAIVSTTVTVCPSGYKTESFGNNCYKNVGDAKRQFVQGEKFCCRDATGGDPSCDSFQPRSESAGASVGYYYNCGAWDECYHKTEYVGSCTKYTATWTCSVSGAFAINGYCYYSASKLNKVNHAITSYK